jgi:hypothetical protein
LASALFVLVAATALAASSFSSWAPAMSLESVPGASAELNSAYLDGCPILSPNGKKLYLATNRPGSAALDIWVAERSSKSGPFGAPVNLGAPINSEYNDFCPSPLRFGWFMFVSDRPHPDSCGGGDIYLTRWSSLTGWQEPVNLGCEINSSGAEFGPIILHGSGGGKTLFFSSNRVGGPGGSAADHDLYQARAPHGWSFGPVMLVPGVNSAYDDAQPSIRRDGLELFFYSTRPGGLGGPDIWSAGRAAKGDPWSAPVNLGPAVNSEAGESRPSISLDGLTLVFGTTRPGVEGVSDIFFTTREKLVGP